MRCNRSIISGVMLLAVGSAIAGCLYIPTPHHSLIAGRGMIEPDVIEQCRIGVTTREEILLRFGEPDATLNRQSVFVYSWTRTQGYLLIGGYGRGEVIPVGHTSRLLVEFDLKGFLKRIELMPAGLAPASVMQDAAVWVSGGEIP